MMTDYEPWQTWKLIATMSPGGRGSSSQLYQSSSARWAWPWREESLPLSLFGQTTGIMNTDSGNSDLSLAMTTWMEKHCMLLGLLSAEMTAANLVNLAMLQSVCDVLMRTTECYSVWNLKSAVAISINSNQIRKRKPSSETTCHAKIKVLVSARQSPRPCIRWSKK